MWWYRVPERGVFLHRIDKKGFSSAMQEWILMWVTIWTHICKEEGFLEKALRWRNFGVFHGQKKWCDWNAETWGKGPDYGTSRATVSEGNLF